ASDQLDITLYYRFAQTNVLGAQREMLDIRREETVAHSIVSRLVEGPSVTHDRLSGVFPQGTRVISVSGEGSTAFVTLSRDFLGRPDGAPADWEDSPSWQEEAALRRWLAVQSLALSLTENGRYQRVQLYVAANDDDIPERIALAWFDLTQEDMSVVLGPCGRDESMMLTPLGTMTMIMEAWAAKDWEAMRPLLAQEGNLPSASELEAQAREADVSLLGYALSGGAPGMDGQRATVVLDAELHSVSGGDAQIVRESVPLVRQTDNWAIEPDVLLSLMIRD
ncbi:MAG: GerMN domain-containing protein, partial [Clostridia bacterium]|nr:GerMN domain-containing protein [Clostridia bacterium]